ncbi:MAG TPA: hypothetical protein DEB39_04555 [Planctomycetaceae bacterium]|nr:hypothetical protein [Planctomycetaceae bacterium]
MPEPVKRSVHSHPFTLRAVLFFEGGFLESRLREMSTAFSIPYIAQRERVAEIRTGPPGAFRQGGNENVPADIPPDFPHRPLDVFLMPE